MTIKCSIIIRCYNEEKHIGKLLKGILNQTEKGYEIIIVDSGSSDATISIASQYPVKILSINPNEFSFGRSLNFGCEVARGEFIVIASAHVYPVYDDWLQKLLEPFREEKVGLVYGKQRGNNTTKFSEHQVFAKWFPEISNFDQQYPFCNNANAAIRRYLWQEVHYDENLTGLEDLEWATKIINKGLCLAYASEAEIVHVHNETYLSIFNRYRREAIAFKKIFPEESFSILDFFRLMVINIISDYYYAFVEKVISKNILSIPMFRIMQFWGTYQGFYQKGIVSKKLRHTFYYPRKFYSNNQYSKKKNSQSIEKSSRKYIDYQYLIRQAKLDKT